MADGYNIQADELIKIFQGDSVMNTLLGKIGVTAADGISALDSTSVVVDNTVGFPDAGYFLLTSDNTIVSYTSVLATSFEGCGSHRATVDDEEVALISVHDRPRDDIRRYHESELPAVAIMMNGDNADEFPTIGAFDANYQILIEIVNGGSDLKAVENECNRVLAETRRIVRAETNKTAPINGNADHVTWLGSEKLELRDGNKHYIVYECGVNVLEVSVA